MHAVYSLLKQNIGMAYRVQDDQVGSQCKVPRSSMLLNNMISMKKSGEQNELVKPLNFLDDVGKEPLRLEVAELDAWCEY